MVLNGVESQALLQNTTSVYISMIAALGIAA